MRISLLKGWRAAALSFALMAVAGTVFAPAYALAAWPERPVTMIVPVGAGGGTDTHARALAAELQEVTGIPVNVVNRPGGGGYVGAQAVVDSRADGHTIMIQSYGTFMLRNLARERPVHPLEDFKIVAVVGELFTGLVVRRDDDRFSTLQDFLAHAKANPGMTYGFSGAGSWHNAAALSVEKSAGYEGKPVVFKGGGNVRAAILGGQTDFVWMGVQQLSGFEDQLVMLGVNAENRYPLMDEVPTFAEMGIEATLVTSPMVVAVPAGVDDETVAAIESAVEKAATSAGYGEALKAKLAVPQFLPAAEARTYLEGLYEKWSPIAAAMN